ncbi:MAG: glycosyltransferase family 39 protein [Candidatus Paceibacterota bacterium]
MIVLAVLAVLQAKTLYLPLDRDEGEFALMGQEILNGIIPYNETYTMKLPGSAFLYSLIMFLFGASIAGIHLGLIVVRFLSSLLVFAFARRFMSNISSFISALSYSVLSASIGVMGTAFYPEQAIVLFFLSGMYLLVRKTDETNDPFFSVGRYFFQYLTAGICFGLAVLIKQHSLVFFPIGLLAIHYKHSLFYSTKMFFKRSAVFLLGSFLPLLIVATYFFYSEAWNSFVFWCFTYSVEYASFVPFKEGFPFFFIKIPDIVYCTEILWVLGISGFLRAIFYLKKERFLLLGMLFFSFLAIVPGYYFREHYFIFLLPCIALGIGFLNGASFGLSEIHMSKIVYYFLLILGLFSGLYFYIFEYSFQERLAIIYPAEPNTFYQTHIVSQCVAKHAKENSRILVFGNEPEIYFYTKTKNASKFIYIIEILRPTKLRPKLQDEFLKSVQKEKPEFVIIAPPFGNFPGTQEFLNKMNGFLLAQYKEVSVEFIDSCTRDIPEYDPKNSFIIILEKR